MRLIKLALLYLLDRIKENTSSAVLRYVTISNITDFNSDVKNRDGNILNAFIIMDFHRSKMNEFLRHKFLVDSHKSNSKNDIYDISKLIRTNSRSVENSRRSLISDVGSRQYKSWLTKLGRFFTRENKRSPLKYPYRPSRPRYQHYDSMYKSKNSNFASKYDPSFKGHRKFMVPRNRVEQYQKRRFVTKNRFNDNWKRKKFHKPWQPVSYGMYSRESDSSLSDPYLPSPPSPTVMTNSDKSMPWFVSTEFPYSNSNITMKMNYNFWDMDSSPAPPPSYGPTNDHPSFEPPPSMHGHDISTHEGDDHPVIHWNPPGQDCNGDSQGDDSDDTTSDDSPLSNLLNNDMYQMVLIAFAFVGFATFFMNLTSGLYTGSNGQIPSIMFVGSNNEEEAAAEAEARKFEREAYLNNLVERITQYIEQFQEMSSSMTHERQSESDES